MTISPFTDCVIYQDLPIVLFTAVIQLISKTGYTWTEGIATHFIFSYSGLYNYCEYGIEHVFGVEGHIILKILLILRI